MQDLFKGLKVVELASVLAGPAVGMFFAELGADVIKIENKKTKGDVTRNWHISSEDKSKTASYYYSINYKKKSILLDISIENDYQELLTHLKGADILISNFSENASLKLKVDYNHLNAKFPSLIYAQLTGFLHQKKRLAYDIVLQAETGFLSMCGIDSNQKARIPVALIDVLAAHQLKEGILIALLERHKTGHGKKIEATLEESAIASLVNQATNYLMAGHIAKPLGTQHPNIAPYGDIFVTADNEEVVLSIGSDVQFSALCKLLEFEELASDSRFETNAARVANRSELIKKIAPHITKITTVDFMKKALDSKIPVGHVKNLHQVLTGEVAQSMILESTDGSKRLSTIGFKIK